MYHRRQIHYDRWAKPYDRIKKTERWFEQACFAEGLLTASRVSESERVWQFVRERGSAENLPVYRCEPNLLTLFGSGAAQGLYIRRRECYCSEEWVLRWHPRRQHRRPLRQLIAEKVREGKSLCFCRFRAVTLPAILIDASMNAQSVDYETTLVHEYQHHLHRHTTEHVRALARACHVPSDEMISHAAEVEYLRWRGWRDEKIVAYIAPYVDGKKTAQFIVTNARDVLKPQ